MTVFTSFWAWVNRPREALYPCVHREHDCTDLGCPCLCERCIDDRLAIYRAHPELFRY